MSTPPITSPRERDDPLRAIGAELAARPYARRGIAARDEPVRVVLVDDHAMLRAGLKALLATTPDVMVVGEASSGDDAVPVVQRLAPQVVVMDLEMPRGDGMTATRTISALPSPPRVLILTMHAEEEW